MNTAANPVIRQCNSCDCDWKGVTDRMLGSVGPLCPECGETTELVPTFPERCLSRPAEQQGMFRKFDVRRVDGSDQPGGKHYGCRYFVLDLTHDQHAPAAMRAYAASCVATHPQLAADIVAEFGKPMPTSEAGLTKDAARYRWMRPLANLKASELVNRLWDDKLDAAIDAEMRPDGGAA